MARARLFVLSLLFASRSFADETPFYSNEKYNEAGFGQYVTQTFLSNPQITAVPVVNFMKPFSNCDDGSYLFITPRGYAAESTPMVLDAGGGLVWASTQKYGQVYNLQVQQYKNQHYLTFWGGNDAIGGHGIGEYIMLDQRYNERHRIKAANNLGADLHAFTITLENTALITVYQAILVDISSKIPGRAQAWIWDAIFQELDVETGEALFEWRASAHIPITNSYQEIVNAASEDDPWDAYHINSVEKDLQGNYLISVRYLRAILYIDGRTGEVLWQLGGMGNSFADLSGGAAISFMGQHDAHWHDGHRYITFFDNRADWGHAMDDQSRGTRVEVNLENMTASLDATFTDPYFKILSTSQGSYQTLPNGNVVLGYGFNGAVSEFSSLGELLCEAYFQPASAFTSGNVQSYRNLRFNWTAYPDSNPSLAFSASSLYISWNGATEVDSWLLIGSESWSEEYEKVVAVESSPKPRSVENTLIVAKAGFETAYQIHQGIQLSRYVRAVALTEDGIALGSSNVVDTGVLTALDLDDSHSSEEHDSPESENADLEKDIEDKQVLIGFGVMAMLSAIFITCLILGRKTGTTLWRYLLFKQEAEQASGFGQSLAGGFFSILQGVRDFSRSGGNHEHWDDNYACEGLLAQHEIARLDHIIPENRVNDSIRHDRYRTNQIVT